MKRNVSNRWQHLDCEVCFHINVLGKFGWMDIVGSITQTLSQFVIKRRLKLIMREKNNPWNIISSYREKLEKANARIAELEQQLKEANDEINSLQRRANLTERIQVQCEM
jgi:biopolymer transport protein ExbB/TolQ